MLETKSRLKLGCIPEQWVWGIRDLGYMIEVEKNTAKITTLDGKHYMAIEYYQEDRVISGMGWRVRWDYGETVKTKRIGDLHCAIEDWMWIQEEYDTLFEKMDDRLNELMLVVPNLVKPGRPAKYNWYGYDFLSEKVSHGRASYTYPVLWFSQWKARPWSLKLDGGPDKWGRHRRGRTLTYKHVDSLIKGVKRIVNEGR